MKIVFIGAFLLLNTSSFAQNDNTFKTHKQNVVTRYLQKRYYKNNIDTMFLTRPSTHWTVKLRCNVSGAWVKAQGNNGTSEYQSHVDASLKSTISMAVSYLGISVGLSFNPAYWTGKYSDLELNVNAYGNRWGMDATFQNAKNMKGWAQLDSQEKEIPTGIVTLESLYINTYYAFNYQKFSYPAAFTQSYVQKKSAGSVLVGLSFHGQRIKINANEALNLDDQELKSMNFAIGAGYGYNFVLKSKWLFHISALPTFIVYGKDKLTVEGEEKGMESSFPKVIIVARGAIIKSIGRYFCGTTMVFNYSKIGNSDILSVSDTKWRIRFLVGIRL